MKNIQFNLIEEADLFVKRHCGSDPIGRTKALSRLMDKACIHGVKEVLHPYSPHYFDHPLSPNFAKEMYNIGVDAFVEKMMGASQHIWRKRRKLQAFASKCLVCPSLKEATIEPGCASIDIHRLEYWDRTIYAVNGSGFKLLSEQKPVILEWFIDVFTRNKTFKLGTPRKKTSEDYYDMAEITIAEAIGILDNDYVVPHISVETAYWKEYGEGYYRNCEVSDDWQHYCSSVEISFSSVQSEFSSESHLYGDTVYLWAGHQPCSN